MQGTCSAHQMEDDLTIWPCNAQENDDDDLLSHPLDLGDLLHYRLQGPVHLLEKHNPLLSGP